MKIPPPPLRGEKFVWTRQYRLELKFSICAIPASLAFPWVQVLDETIRHKFDQAAVHSGVIQTKFADKFANFYPIAVFRCALQITKFIQNPLSGLFDC